MNATRLTVFALAMTVMLGCGPREPAKTAPPTGPTSDGASSAPLPPQAPQAPVPPKPNAGPAAPAAPTTPPVVQTKAAVRDRGYGVGVIATPVASYFAMRERLAYDIQIPEAMKLFKATEDRLPRSHEEFMERIVKENRINLPQLPEGHRYMYDPKLGQLMVERPEGE